MGQIHLFTGENAFALRGAVTRWVREFKERHGEANLTRVMAEKVRFADFLNEISTAPFIAERRLVIVKGIPSFFTDDTEESGVRTKGSKKDESEMTLLLKEVHPHVVLLFIAPKPDRRLTFTKELIKAAQVQDFPLLKGEALLQWMRSLLRDLHAAADAPALAFLLETVGEDQMALSQELAKLALYARGRPVTREAVSLLAMPSAERTVWRLTDLLGEGRTQEAVSYVCELLRHGESAQGIWPILLWILTSLTQVVAALEKGTTSLQSIVEQTGVKFNAARSLLPLARKVGSQHAVTLLRPLLDRVARADIGFKTGTLGAGADPEEEVAAAVLERCLLAFPN